MLSSAASTAFLTWSGTLSRVTLTRFTFSGRTVASSGPGSSPLPAKVNVATWVIAASSALGTGKTIQPITKASTGPSTASASSE